MRTVTAMDMRKKLGEILDAASAGERILIERDHRPLAYLVSVEDGQRLDPDEGDRRRRRLAALDRLEAFAKEMAIKHPPPNDGLTEVEWRRQEYERRDEQIDRAARGLPPLEDD
jgi:prevent-host-death family protein